MANGRRPAARRPRPGGEGRARAFISYAHDSDDHRDLVREFWFFLRRNGIDARSDIDAAERRQEWAKWIDSQLTAGDFILVIGSPAYRQRAAGFRNGTSGRGVEYEASLIRELLYADRAKWFPRILPVILPGRSHRELPDFLLPESSTVYRVTDFTVAGAESLLRYLTGQSRESTPDLGLIPELRPRRIPPPRPPAASERAANLDQLAAELSKLPIVATAGARRTFTEMIVERFDGHLMVGSDADLETFLRGLIDELAAQPGGLAGCADVVEFLHRGTPMAALIRQLVERAETIG
jgi:hypothetical protein